MSLFAAATHSIDGTIAYSCFSDGGFDWGWLQIRIATENVTGAQWQNGEVASLDPSGRCPIDDNPGRTALDDMELGNRPGETEAPGSRILIHTDELAVHPHEREDV